MDEPDAEEPDDRPVGDEAEEPFDDDGYSSPLPPEDRLWRHPSEVRLPTPGTFAPPPVPPQVVPVQVRPATSWSTVAVSGLLGAALSLGVVAAAGTLRDEQPVRETVVRETVAPAFAPRSQSGSDPVVGIAEEAASSVVRIEVRGDEDGSGSGVMFRDDGHVLTNAHVVDDADRIVVVLADGSSYDAELVGYDEITDIAVVKVSGPTPFATALIGTAADLQVGQATVAIGSPLGLLGGSSVTTGVVSALGREVDSQEGPPLLDMIQTDAAIAPGSSGGALLDMRGTVIGITTAIAVSQVGGEGLGFAVPIDLATKVGAEIIEHGEAVHVWLGIEGRDLDATVATDAGLKGGAEVTSVARRSPADEAGIGEGDVIIAIDDEQVPSMAGLVISLRDRAPGDVAVLTFIRGGEVLDAAVTLQERR